MEWIGTAQGLVALITGLVGLIGAGVSTFVAIKALIKSMKQKNFQANWNFISQVADAAMKQVETSGKAGAEKKQIVIDTVKTACKSAGIEADMFIDQLMAYIDQCIDFYNGMKQKN